MFLLKSVEIAGLWGERTAKVAFHPDVNFLIGPNGSGKTTVVNILASILNVDRRGMVGLPYVEASVVLFDPSKEDTAQLDVQKEPTESGTISVRYTVQRPNSETQSFVLIEPQMQRPYRALGSRLLSPTPKQLIGDLVNMRWLSVHRAPFRMTRSDDKSYDSTVDIKLDEVGEAFAKYFSKLSNQSTKRLLRFIDSVSLSIIDQPEFKTVASIVDDLDIDEERKTVADMFRTIYLKPDEFGPPLDRLTEILRQVVEKQRMDVQLSYDEIGSIFAMSRLRALEEQWRLMQKDREQIMKPIDDFRASLNRLFANKFIDINDKNELGGRLSHGSALGLRDFSSGEKQLIILFGEALLQEQATSVYLADEPELSLHVAWQEQLVSSLRELNPNGQLIFATHSPDIVSAYGDHVIDMEAVLV